MNGYLAITSDAWCKNIKQFGVTSAVFWRKKLRFCAIQPNESFFFLSRKRSDGTRYILGQGEYVESLESNVKDAWDRYTIQLGSDSEESFVKNIQGLYKTSDTKIGCIVLKNIQFYSIPIPLDRCNIEFSPYIVSGKTINNDECMSLLACLKEGV